MNTEQQPCAGEELVETSLNQVVEQEQKVAYLQRDYAFIFSHVMLQKTEIGFGQCGLLF